MSAGKTVDTILAAHAARLEMGSGGELATQRLSRDVARALVADLRAAGHEADDVAADGGYYVYVTASLGTRAGDPMKLPELLEKLGVRAKAHPAPLPAHLVANFGSTRDVSKGTSWKVDLIGFDKRGAARVLQTPYWQGSAHKGPPIRRGRRLQPRVRRVVRDRVLRGLLLRHGVRPRLAAGGEDVREHQGDEAEAREVLR